MTNANIREPITVSCIGEKNSQNLLKYNPNSLIKMKQNIRFMALRSIFHIVASVIKSKDESL